MFQLAHKISFDRYSHCTLLHHTHYLNYLDFKNESQGVRLINVNFASFIKLEVSGMKMKN